MNRIWICLLTLLFSLSGPALGEYSDFGRWSNAAKKLPISTGRTTPNSLKEKLAMEEVMSKPSGYTPKGMPKMSDTKNGLLHEDGWVKRAQNVNGVEIHYVENINTGQVLDFKFK